MMHIIDGDLTDPRVVDLLHTHLIRAHAQTAAGSAHALDIAGLKNPAISLWTVWKENELAGAGGLKRLSGADGEVKSMYTVERFRSQGAGSAILRHLIDTAKSRGMSRLLLETGSWEYFLPARALYRRHGFVECEPFADYVPDRNSVFMSLELHKSPRT
ncbi:MAG: GNAT family N-acetyltransferase [Steroidobacteraceae bacterium]